MNTFKNKKQLSDIVLCFSTVVTTVVGSMMMYYGYGFSVAFVSADVLKEYMTRDPLKFILGKLFLGCIIIFVSLAVYYCLTNVLLWIVNISIKSINKRLDEINMWVVVLVLFIELIMFIFY